MKRNYAPVIVLVILGIIYALISLVNHSNYRTSALDLGLYTHASWKYAHLSIPDRSLFEYNHDPLLADHFDLHLVLWAPLTYIFGEWTLLLVQIIALLAGAFGIYRYVLSLTADASSALIAMVMGGASFATLSAVTVDFHSNVVAAMALPWYLLAIHKGRVLRSWSLLAFMLIAKENIGLWLGVVALSAIALPRSVSRRTLVLQSIVSFVWAAVIIGMVMPALDSTDTYAHFDYSVLGRSPGDALKTLFDRPFHAFRALFEDIDGRHPVGTAIKVESWFILLLGGGWALFRSIPHLLMCLPIIAQKLWNDGVSKWGIFNQYSIEFSMILPVAVIAVVNGKNSRIPLIVALLLALSATLHSLDLPVEHSDPRHGYHDRSRFYQERHYQIGFDDDTLQKVMASIPADAALSCQTTLLPHMIARHKLYQFPIMHEADHVLLCPKEFEWPLDRPAYDEMIQQMKTSDEWLLLVDDPTVLLFKRK
jgi:uncharacterized membrane protein